MLNEDALQKLIAHISAKWKTTACPQCAANSWSANGYVTMIMSDHVGIVLGDPVLPIIALTCNNCGNSIMINAVIAGIPPPPREKGKIEHHSPPPGNEPEAPKEGTGG